MLEREEPIEEYVIDINIKSNVFTNAKILSKITRINTLLNAESMEMFLASLFDEIDDCNFNGGFTNFNVIIKKAEE